MGRPGPSNGSAGPPVRAAKGAREGRAVAFTQAAVSRAVRGVTAGGLQPSEVEIMPCGTIRLLIGHRGADLPAQIDEAAYFERMLGHVPE
jgi:hypothetical protein